MHHVETKGKKSHILFREGDHGMYSRDGTDGKLGKRVRHVEDSDQAKNGGNTTGEVGKQSVINDKSECSSAELKVPRKKRSRECVSNLDVNTRLLDCVDLAAPKDVRENFILSKKNIVAKKSDNTPLVREIASPAKMRRRNILRDSLSSYDFDQLDVASVGKVESCSIFLGDSPEVGDFPSEDAKAQLTNKKVIGARVYAEFTNKQYYWGRIGEITKRVSEEQVETFKIYFEDGDVLDVPAEHVYTEQDYSDAFQELPPPQLQTLPDTWAKLDSQLDQQESKSRDVSTKTKGNNPRILDLTRDENNEARKALDHPEIIVVNSSEIASLSSDDTPEHVDKQKFSCNVVSKKLSSSKTGSLHSSANVGVRRRNDYGDVKNIKSTSCTRPAHAACESSPSHPSLCDSQDVEKRCLDCRRLPCGRCFICQQNGPDVLHHTSGGCLWKACSNLAKLKENTYPATGLFDGWRFICRPATSNLSSTSVVDEDEVEKRISFVTSTGRAFSSLRSVIRFLPQNYVTKDVLRPFLIHIGCGTLDSQFFLRASSRGSSLRDSIYAQNAFSG